MCQYYYFAVSAGRQFLAALLFLGLALACLTVVLEPELIVRDSS